MHKARSIIVLGAGIIGVSVAGQLQERGWRVRLIDRHPPASETSHGNAGIISTSSAVPFNNPALRRQLPALLLRDNPALHWRLPYIIANFSWCLRFLYHGGYASSLNRAQQLHALIARGEQLHRQWLAAAEHSHLIKEGGWLKLYRSRRGLEQAGTERRLWDELAVPYKMMSPEDIMALLPVTPGRFAAGVLIEKAFSIMNPAAAVRAYADRFIIAGGEYIEQEITALQRDKNRWLVELKNGEMEHSPQVVVALGPWSREVLAPLGIALPLGFERGAHRHFALKEKAPAVAFTDVDGGYSAAMQEDTLRLTSGVYFAALHHPPPQSQLNAAEHHLRQALSTVGATVGADWFGARPTLPDSLPLIGQCRQQGLWLATGHQHIGLMSGPATGECLAQLINDELTTVPAIAFSPQRYGI